MKNYNHFIKLFSITLGAWAVWTVSTACSHYPEPESYRYSIFDPSEKDITYLPFRFDMDYFGNGEFEPLVKLGIEKNLSEWAAYFDHKISEQAIKELVYDYNCTYEELNNPKPFVATEGKMYCLPLMQYLLYYGDTATLGYILFAKKCEKALSASNPWNDRGHNSADLGKLLQEAKKSWENSPNSWLKVRYGYQMVILARYLEDYDQVIDNYCTYLDIEEAADNSILKKWATAHLATAQHFTGNVAKADYTFAQVFKNTVSKRERAFKGFEGKQIDSSLYYAHNNEEKANIWLLKGLRSSGRAFSAVQKVYQLAPNSEGMTLLLNREINKLEDWILTEPYTGFSSANNDWGDENDERDYAWNASKQVKQNSNYRYLRKVRRFVVTATTQKKVQNRAY